MSGIQLGSSNDMSNVKTVTFDDTAAPSNPSDGQGILYKKTGSDGLFWLPDSSGLEVNIFKGTESFEWVGSADTDESFVIQPYQSIYLKCDDVTPGSVITLTLNVDLIFINMSTGTFSTASAGITSADNHMSNNITSIVINNTSTVATLDISHTSGGPGPGDP